MKKIKVLLVDDHVLVRKGIKSLLNTDIDIQVISEASNGGEAIWKVEEMKPDVIVMDINMLEIDGLEATKLIRERNKEIKILILSMYDIEEYIYKSLKFGADGYLLKNADRNEFIEAIHTVAKGGRYFSKDISKIMQDAYVAKAANRPLPNKDGIVPLTKREKEILTLIVEGLNNHKIGEKLFISPRTVDTHRSNIMVKLLVKNTAQLVKYAIKNKIVEL